MAVPHDWVLSLGLVLAGLLAGFIDSIAGGGGLITLPVFSLLLGKGPLAIGTNKIAGTAAALVALFIYARKGHFNWRSSLIFAVFVAGGAALGSRISPLLPLWIFPWLLAVTCPFILWVVWKRNLWVEKVVVESVDAPKLNRLSRLPAIAISGLVCGFYDGVWGPGGGTFMFLSLLFFAGLPILTALSASKFANTSSALVSLVSYNQQGFVRWWPGVVLAIGIAIGAWFGATHASRNAARLIRPVLAIVVLLLLIKVVATSLV